MERLSEKLKDVLYETIGALSQVEEDIIKAALDRLAAYEDTGLEPEEISDAVGWMSPVCIGCDGKTPEGARTDKCGYLAGEIHKCMERSKHLAELAQVEQEGRLVVPPCKVGDTVFDIFGGSVKEKTIVSITFLISQSVKHMTIHAENHRGAITELELLRFGKTWFLTREEAEAALAADTNVGHTEGGST